MCFGRLRSCGGPAGSPKSRSSTIYGVNEGRRTSGSDSVMLCSRFFRFANAGVSHSVSTTNRSETTNCAQLTEIFDLNVFQSSVAFSSPVRKFHLRQLPSFSTGPKGECHRGSDSINFRSATVPKLTWMCQKSSRLSP